MRYAMLCFGGSVVATFAGAAHAVIVDGTELAQYTSVTNQLGMTHGVVFSSTMPFVTFGINGTNTVGIYGTEPTANPNANYAWYSSPIEIMFVDMNDGFSPALVSGTINAVFGDGGGDTDGIRVRAYDINNNLIATQTALSVTFGPISISGIGIRRLVFDQSGFGSPTSDTFLDWIDFPAPVAVPAPGAAALGGVALWAGLRRKRRGA